MLTYLAELREGKVSASGDRVVKAFHDDGQRGGKRPEEGL